MFAPKVSTVSVRSVLGTGNKHTYVAITVQACNGMCQIVYIPIGVSVWDPLAEVLLGSDNEQTQRNREDKCFQNTT